MKALSLSPNLEITYTPLFTDYFFPLLPLDSVNCARGASCMALTAVLV